MKDTGLVLCRLREICIGRRWRIGLWLVHGTVKFLRALTRTFALMLLCHFQSLLDLSNGISPSPPGESRSSMYRRCVDTDRRMQLLSVSNYVSGRFEHNLTLLASKPGSSRQYKLLGSHLLVLLAIDDDNAYAESPSLSMARQDSSRSLAEFHRTAQQSLFEARRRWLQVFCPWWRPY